MGFWVLQVRNRALRSARKLLSLAAIAFASVWSAQASASAAPIRIGVTPAIVHDQYELLADWQRYLEERLGRSVEFISRDSYRETLDLLKLKKLDYAWVSTYPYVYAADEGLARLLVVPIYKGRPLYRGYLIVPSTDTRTTSLTQLQGQVFAYADPYSHTGFILPRYMLRAAGFDPNHFFRRTYFTWSHRKAVEAVANGFAAGASVDSFVWDTLAVIQPELTRRTRIVSRSPEYGFPPLIANRSVGRADFAEMQRVLIGMAADPAGSALLRRLNLDGFEVGDPSLYREVDRMMKSFR